MTLADTAATLQRFTVARDDRGAPVITLDGDDITSQLYRYTIEETAQDGARVVLELSRLATRRAAFDGLARVEVGEPPTLGDAAATFLAAIDPEQLEAAALQSDKLGTGPHALTEAMLDTLIAWARGGS